MMAMLMAGGDADAGGDDCGGDDSGGNLLVEVEVVLVQVVVVAVAQSPRTAAATSEGQSCWAQLSYIVEPPLVS